MGKKRKTQAQKAAAQGVMSAWYALLNISDEWADEKYVYPQLSSTAIELLIRKGLVERAGYSTKIRRTYAGRRFLALE